MSAHDLLVTSFKKPTAEELAHDFLWRIRKALPPSGKIGIFDRSHYEDVLVVRVHDLQPAAEIERRYGAINEFEQAYIDGGGTILKCLLHVDKDIQKQRLTERLEDPAKYWKHNPGDLEERAKWDEYVEAYQLVLDRCSEVAPWHVVPSGHKWYRNWAVSALVLDALRGMDLQWPMPDFDVEAERARVAAS
jgi:PPK2 family polyphosphate:nucleotide phosphotransferase